MSSQSHLVSPKANVASFPIYDNSEDKDFRPNDKLKKSIGKSPKRERAEKRVASKQYNFVDPFPSDLDDDDLMAATPSKKISNASKSPTSPSPDLEISPNKKAKIVNVYSSTTKQSTATKIIPTNPTHKHFPSLNQSNNTLSVSSFRPQVKWNDKEIDQLKKLKAAEPNRPFYDIAMLIGNGKSVAQCKVKWAEISNRMNEACSEGRISKRRSTVDSSALPADNYTFNNSNSDKPMSAPIKKKSKGSVQIPALGNTTLKGSTSSRTVQSLEASDSRARLEDDLASAEKAVLVLMNEEFAHNPSSTTSSNSIVTKSTTPPFSPTPLDLSRKAISLQIPAFSINSKRSTSSRTVQSLEASDSRARLEDDLASAEKAVLVLMNEEFAHNPSSTTSSNSIVTKSTTPPFSPPQLPAPYPALSPLPTHKTFTLKGVQTSPSPLPSPSAPIKSLVKKRLEQEKKSDSVGGTPAVARNKVTLEEFDAAIKRILATDWD